MAKYRSRAEAPGDHDLPDLTLDILLLGEAQARAEEPGMPPIDLLQQYLLHHQAVQDSSTSSSIHGITRAKRHAASALIKPNAKQGGGFSLGHHSLAQRSSDDARVSSEHKSCTSSASNSEWSLTYVHASPLNAFDKHHEDSDAIQNHADRPSQQLICLQSGHQGPETPPRRSRHQKHRSYHPPMLQRWLNQLPRQEGFNGLAATEVPSTSHVRSCL